MMALSEQQRHLTEQERQPGMMADEISRLPIDPKTGRAQLPRAQPGYYPGYHTLSQQNFWDEATRNLVVGRVEKVPQISFFTPDEERLMQAILDRILPQDDRDEAHKIPILPYIDERLATGRINGYRYAHMPPDEEAYRLGLQGIDAIARHMHKQPFVELEPLGQDQVLLTLHDGNPLAGEAIWQRVSVNHFWIMLLQDAVEVYYAHPYAWDEVGYGGPAYPRGYIRLENGRPESWEVEERRCSWAPPPTTLSGEASREGEHGHDEPRHGASGTR
jgi:hypothetical protein